MPGNSFGLLFRFTGFGESHGHSVGGVIDGFPPGIIVDEGYIRSQLLRRRPGQSIVTTSREEDDELVILSGVFEGKTTGAPIAFLIENRDQRPEDYYPYRHIYRPSHADFTYHQKYGHYDYRGGGRASARETAARVAAGAFAELLLREFSIQIVAFTTAIGPVSIQKIPENISRTSIDLSPVRCPDNEVSLQMVKLIEEVKDRGDSLGGVVHCIVTGVPAGLGEPVFDKLSSDLARAMLSINAVKGFEIGAGFRSATMTGSEYNDRFIRNSQGYITTVTNHSGGIQGGISNGREITFNVAFHPPSSIALSQETVDHEGNPVTVSITGRYDPCVVIRAIPVVEAMTALVIADHLLRYSSYKHVSSRIISP